MELESLPGYVLLQEPVPVEVDADEVRLSDIINEKGKISILGLGVMLAAGEVPRIAQQFGLDSSVKVNMMSVVRATSTAVNMTRSVARAMA